MPNNSQMLSLQRTFETVDPAGSVLTIAYDITNAGKIIGFYVDENADAHGFTYDHQYSSFDDPFAEFPGTFAERGNDQGQVVGSYLDAGGINHSFLYSDGVSSAFVVPFTGAGETDAWDINSTGDVVGLYFDALQQAHGFLDVGGHFITLDDPVATGKGTMALGVNDLDQVVGHYYDSANTAHGFLETDGRYLTIDDPLAGSKGTFPKEINNVGQIVGVYYDNEGFQHGFLYNDGTYSTIDNPLGVKGSLVYGINDSGGVVGYYKDAEGVAHGFVSAIIPITAPDVELANSVILRIPIDETEAAALADQINKGVILGENYVLGLAHEAKDTSAAVLSVAEFFDVKVDADLLDAETHNVNTFTITSGAAAGWVRLGAALVEADGAKGFRSAYGALDSDQFVTSVTHQVFGAPFDTGALHAELASFEAYFGGLPDLADPAGSIRARGAFVADMLHQASDYAESHPGSPAAQYQQASAAFLIGLLDGSRDYGQSIFS